ncbi:MAG: carbohydrate-binding protein [Cyanobacteria bacterium P01_F01_bin.143]
MAVFPLTNNNFDDYGPEISGNNVVWYSYDGNDYEIYLYDHNRRSIAQLTDNDTYEYSPQISGNNVVWTGYDDYDNEIYLYNGSDVIQLTDNDTYEYALQISGNNVVWTAYDDYDNEIYLYNGSDVIQLTDNDTYEYSPQISGNNVVWTAYDGYDNEIYLYNGSDVIQLTDNDTYEYSPQISGNNVVWTAYDGYDDEIYLYNGSDVIQLTDNDTSEYSLQISGNNVVWSVYDGYDNEIYLYNGSNTIQLTDNDLYEYSPQISGNNVVWSAYDGNDDEIYLYNGSNIIQLTDNNTPDYSPQISGNNVVWTSYDGYDNEIYLNFEPLAGIRVEAEDYVNYYDTTIGNTGGAYRNDNVDIESSTDIGGGFNVGYIAEGEWLTYNLDVPEDGYYQVVTRVASALDDRTHSLDITLDGHASNVSFEGTGGWQSWSDVSSGNLHLTAGSHELRLDMNSSGFNINYVDLLPLTGSRIEAENYVNYFDTTSGNTGEAYRNDDVDLEVTTDVGGGYNVGWISQGDWLTYNLHVPEDDSYQLSARVASDLNRDHSLDITLDGQTHTVNFNNTGGWQSWENVVTGELELHAGNHELRLDMGSSGFNLNYIDLLPVTAIKIEAEDYTNYSDTTTGNSGGAYRNNDVDIEATTDIGGGFNVGWIEEGEWLTYDVDVPEDGFYEVRARVASDVETTHSLDVSLDGQTTNLSFSGTGDWQSWENAVGGINLTAGSHEMRLDMGSSLFNINYIELIPHIEEV